MNKNENFSENENFCEIYKRYMESESLMFLDDVKKEELKTLSESGNFFEKVNFILERMKIGRNEIDKVLFGEKKEIALYLMNFMNMENCDIFGKNGSKTVFSKERVKEIIKNNEIEHVLKLIVENHSLSNGKQVLHYVAGLGEGSMLFIALLFHFCKNPNQEVLDNKKRSLEYYAIKNNRLLNLVVIILFCDVKTHRDVYHRNCVMYSCQFKNILSFDLFSKLNFSDFFKLTDSVNNWNCLFFATFSYYNFLSEHQIKMCLEILPFIDVSHRDNEQNNILHYLAHYQNSMPVLTEMISKKMLNSKIINCCNKNVESPLSIAFRRENYDFARALINSGAKIKTDTYIIVDDTKIDDDLKNILSKETNKNSKKNLVCTHFEAKKTLTQVCFSDFSFGQESVYIQLMNHIDEVNFFTVNPNFIYTKKPIFTEYIKLRSKLCGCSCKDDCYSNPNCECIKKCEGSKKWYNNSMCDVDEMGLLYMPVLYECNPLCQCNKNRCRNRLVQNGIKESLSITKTADKGYGLQALKKIKKGAFVIEYTGMVLSQWQANVRANDEYLMDIETKEVNGYYCIDAFNYGNASRFINHSCEPNLLAVRVLYDHHDDRLPHICYFATKDVEAGEFLHIDYEDDFWNKKGHGCLCGLKGCKYKKKF